MQNPERTTDRIVTGLGLASIALGVPMLTRTDAVARFAGVDDEADAAPLIQAVGARELVHAALLLLGPHRTVWTRVAGDALDLAVLGRALAARSGERRSRTATATALVGGITLVDLWAARRTRHEQHGRGRPGPLELHASVTVNRPPEEVYGYWRDLERLPTFMLHLRSVTETGDGRSRWEANAPLRRSVSWEAQLTGDEPGRRISWRSLPGSKVDNAGTVHFAAAPGDRGTEVAVVLHYDVPGGRAGRLVAKLLGEEPEQQVRDDLRRFKQVMETGRVVRSDGLPSGADARHQVAQRPAQPVKDERASNHR